MLYFAYGSNLDWQQMQNRCPSAEFICRAVIPDYRLAFTRRSSKRNCGVADVIPYEGSMVWGVVYQISETDVGALDGSEGFKPDRERCMNAYVREEFRAFTEGDTSNPLLVSVYIANKQDDPPLPNNEYKELIVQGARYWHLPEEYIEELEHIRTT